MAISMSPLAGGHSISSLAGAKFGFIWLNFDPVCPSTFPFCLKGFRECFVNFVTKNISILFYLDRHTHQSSHLPLLRETSMFDRGVLK